MFGITPKYQARKSSLSLKAEQDLKNLFFPPLSESGQLIDDSVKKADIFNQFFTSKSTVSNPDDQPPFLEKNHHQ